MTSAYADRVSYSTKPDGPTCLDLFSGAGGLSVGFSMAGGRPLGAVDIDQDSISTYRSLFPFAQDIDCCEIKSWKPKSQRGEIDLIIGGPPCQGFSLARGLRFVDDPRNHLYKSFINLVGILQPPWFVMENVEGITSIGGGAILAQILEDFNAIGYTVSYRVVNMAEYGVPQSRRRAIFVGNNGREHFEWPDSNFRDPRRGRGQASLFDTVVAPFNAVNYALSDLLLPQGNFFAHRANSQMRGPRNRDAHTQPAFTLRVRGDEFALCEHPAVKAFSPGPPPIEEVERRDSQNELQELLSDLRPHWVERDTTQPLRCATPPPLTGTRRLTIREQARLQTFPDWVFFHGKRTSQARQIGNAVPPLFAFQLFSQIFKYL